MPARWRGANLTASAPDRVWPRHGLLERACANLGPAANGACSSDGQSSGFLNRVSGVRVSPGPPAFSVGYGRFPFRRSATVGTFVGTPTAFRARQTPDPRCTAPASAPLPACVPVWGAHTAWWSKYSSGPSTLSESGGPLVPLPTASQTCAGDRRDGKVGGCLPSAKLLGAPCGPWLWVYQGLACGETDKAP